MPDQTTPGERSTPPGGGRTLRGKWKWILLAAVITAVDLWTKESLFTPLQEHRIQWVAGDWFGLTKVWNKGMMWGALQDHGELVLLGLRAMRLLAAAVVLLMILSTPATSRLLLMALGLVLGGAVGNIYDGFVFEAVRDFLLFDFDFAPFDPFPVFNVADSSICVGVGLLAIGLMLDGRHAKETEQENAATGRPDEAARLS
jgi:signal peptidase II